MLQIKFLLHVRAICIEDPHRDRKRVEHLPHRRNDRHPRKMFQVGHHEVGDACPRAGQRDGVAGHHDREHNEYRHHDFGYAFNTILDAGENDGKDAGGENDEPEFSRHAVRNEGAEKGIRRKQFRITGEVFEEVTGDPAADDAVVRQDQHRNDGIDPAPCGKEAALPEMMKSSDRTLSRATSERGLRNDHRIAEGDGQQKVGQEEDASAILCSKIRESPNIPEADSAACDSQHIPHFAGKGTAAIPILICHMIALL